MIKKIMASAVSISMILSIMFVSNNFSLKTTAALPEEYRNYDFSQQNFYDNYTTQMQANGRNYVSEFNSSSGVSLSYGSAPFNTTQELSGLFFGNRDKVTEMATRSLGLICFDESTDDLIAGKTLSVSEISGEAYLPYDYTHTNRDGNAGGLAIPVAINNDGWILANVYHLWSAEGVYDSSNKLIETTGQKPQLSAQAAIYNTQTTSFDSCLVSGTPAASLSEEDARTVDSITYLSKASQKADFKVKNVLNSDGTIEYSIELTVHLECSVTAGATAADTTRDVTYKMTGSVKTSDTFSNNTLNSVSFTKPVFGIGGFYNHGTTTAGVKKAAIRYDFSELGEYINQQIEQLDVSELTLLMEENVVSLYSKFVALSENEKLNVSQENQQKIKTAYQQMQDLIEIEESEMSLYNTVTFEDGEPGVRYFTESTGYSVVKNEYADTVNPSNRVLMISTSNNNPVTFKNALLDGTRQIATFSGKVYVSTGSVSYIIYDYQSENEWNAIRLYIDKTYNGFCARQITYSEGKITNGSRYNFNFHSNEELGYQEGWLDFAFEYTLTGVTLTIQAECEENVILLGNCKSGQIKLLDTNYVKVGFAGSGNAYIDDLNVTFMGTGEYIAAKRFTEKYEQLLNLIPASSFVATTDEASINQMREEYDALSKNEKCYLPLMEVRIRNLEDVISALKGRADYSDIKQSEEELIEKANAKNDPYTSYTYSCDFENGLRSFMPALSGTVGDKTYTVYDERFQSNALLLKAGQQSLTLKKSLIPGETPQVSAFSFKIHGEDSDYSWHSSLWIPVSYQPDGKDFYCYGWYMYDDTNLGEKYLRLHTWYSKSGKAAIPNGSRDNNLHWGDIFTVEAQYDANGKCIVNVTDEHGGVETLVYPTADLDSIFALVSVSHSVFIDDLTITYRTGSYTKDVDINDINVYYSGNTTLLPGDIAYINGEAIANNVSTVEILRLPDDSSQAMSSNAGFINQTSYNYDGVHEGEFTSEPVSPYWDDEQAVTVPILQKTANSLKIKVPEEFETGIYAVRLWDTEYVSYKIIYLNAPQIDYTIGADGGELTDQKASSGVSASGEEMRVIGNFFTLGGTGENILVKLTNKADTTETYLLDSNSIKVQSDYSLSVTVPADISVAGSKKTFELSVYNGYGNATAWSRPTFITVKPDLRSTWKKDIFNIAEFGADGSDTQNATPYFVDALAAISQNGGGILYLPNGTYRLQSGLILPENLQIIGESQGDVNILFVPYDWEYNNFPDTYLLKFTKNVSIENITFLGTRIPGLFCGYGDSSDNIYLKNIKLHFEPTAGSVSKAPHCFSNTITSSELLVMIAAESINYTFALTNRGSNVRMDSVDFSDVKSSGTKLYNYKNGSFYWYISNCNFDTGRAAYNIVVAHYSIVENNKSVPVVWGDGVYTAENKETGTSTQNNREGWVADLSAEYSGIMTPVNDKADNRFFYLTTTLSSDCTEFAQLYVTDGQGVGQTRRVINSRTVAGSGKNYTMIEVDRPFIVMPNANSSVVIRRNRQSMYFVDNEMRDCAAGFAFYGGCCDIVYDHNVYNGVYTIYNAGIFNDVNWYISYINEELNYMPTLLNIYGAAGHIGYQFWGISKLNAQLGFLVRGCTFNSQYIAFKSSSAHYQVDFIFDNNEFYDLDYAYASQGGSGFNGWYFTRNRYFNVADVFEPNTTQDLMKTNIKATNDVGSKYWIVTDLEEVSIALKLGDVNGDGNITLKDTTLIKYYVVGKLKLSESQVNNANVNGDNAVDIRDASIIRLYLLGKISYSDFISGTFDSDSDASSESSSGETSVDDSSSTQDAESSITPVPDNSDDIYTPWH